MKKIKVFHGLVNYGSQAGLFARELRKLGVQSIAMTFEDSFKRPTDIHVAKPSNRLAGFIYAVYYFFLRLFIFFRYNTFHFYYGTTLFPRQVDLPFYALFGKKVVMEYLGNDCQLYQYSIDKYKWTNMRYFLSPEEGKEYDNKILSRLKFESRFINKKLACSPTYCETVNDAEYLPLAINLERFEYTPMKEDRIIRFLHAPTHQGNKGSAFIFEAFDRLLSEGYPIELKVVENLTHDQLITAYKECHVFIDQIIGGWYGMASIEAMAIGRPVVCFYRQEYARDIPFFSEIPVISADPDSIYDELKNLCTWNKEKFSIIGKQSRLFVERFHDVKDIAQRLNKIYIDLRCAE